MRGPILVMLLACMGVAAADEIKPWPGKPSTPTKPKKTPCEKAGEHLADAEPTHRQAQRDCNAICAKMERKRTECESPCDAKAETDAGYCRADALAKDEGFLARCLASARGAQAACVSRCPSSECGKTSECIWAEEARADLASARDEVRSACK